MPTTVVLPQREHLGVQSMKSMSIQKGIEGKGPVCCIYSVEVEVARSLVNQIFIIYLEFSLMQLSITTGYEHTYF